MYAVSVKIVNNTGSVIIFTSITQGNDHETLAVKPAVGTPIPNGDSCMISVEGEGIFPEVSGFNAMFVCQANSKTGGVSLEAPAVGKSHFGYRNTADFDYDTEHLSGDSFVVTVTLG